MEYLFDYSLHEWAQNYYIDFNTMGFSFDGEDKVLTISEFEILADGTDAWACMFSFYKDKNNYSYIPYQTLKYQELFSNNENRNLMDGFKVKTEDLVLSLRNNPHGLYKFEEKNNILTLYGSGQFIARFIFNDYRYEMEDSRE